MLQRLVKTTWTEALLQYFGWPTPAFFRFIEWINVCYKIFIFTANFLFKWNPLYEFFFETMLLFSSAKSWSIIYFVLYKLFYTHNRSKDTGHFLILCARTFRKCTERERKQPCRSGRLHCAFFQFLSSGIPLLLQISNPYPGVIAVLKVLFELVYP